MEHFTIQNLIRRSKLKSPEDVSAFHSWRVDALKKSAEIYEERAKSYNIDHEPTEEMEYGVVSMASEIFKRAKRMTGLLTPLRGTDPLTKADIERIFDTCSDLINYASWQYALMMVATGRSIDPGHYPGYSVEEVNPDQLSLFEKQMGMKM